MNAELDPMEGPRTHQKMVVLDVVVFVFPEEARQMQAEGQAALTCTVGLLRKVRVIRVLVVPWVGDLCHPSLGKSLGEDGPF